MVRMRACQEKMMDKQAEKDEMLARRWIIHELLVCFSVCFVRVFVCHMRIMYSHFEMKERKEQQKELETQQKRDNMRQTLKESYEKEAVKNLYQTNIFFDINGEFIYALGCKSPHWIWDCKKWNGRTEENTQGTTGAASDGS